MNSSIEVLDRSVTQTSGTRSSEPYVPLSPTVLSDAAERIGTRLCRDAIWHKNHCNWIGPSMEFINSRWQVVDKSMGSDIYAGTAGVALFLTELHRYRPQTPVQRTAEAAMNQAIANTQSMNSSVKSGYHCGLLGLADVAYRMAECFESNHWHDQYQILIDELLTLGPDPEGVDVIMGSAGSIPALIILYQRTAHQALLDLAIQHADQLVDLATSQSVGCSWDTLNTGNQHPHLTGYAHGAAGASLALAELYAATGVEAYGDTARAGFAYENSHFDNCQNNWPDFRNLESIGIDKHQSVCAVAWCHGAAGIGMSRLRAQHLLNDDRLRKDAQTAVATTLQQLNQYLQAPGFDFSYCHGVAGDAELLLLADQYLGGQQRHAQVCEMLNWAIHTYEAKELEWPSGIPEAGESPSLFLGTAGIGHFMLRTAMPDEVDSVLLPGLRHDIRRVT